MLNHAHRTAPVREQELGYIDRLFWKHFDPEVGLEYFCLKCVCVSWLRRKSVAIRMPPESESPMRASVIITVCVGHPVYGTETKPQCPRHTLRLVRRVSLSAYAYIRVCILISLEIKAASNYQHPTHDHVTRVLMTAAGVPFTILAKVLPFILIGIGVDDMVRKSRVMRAVIHRGSYVRPKHFSE